MEEYNAHIDCNCIEIDSAKLDPDNPSSVITSEFSLSESSSETDRGVNYIYQYKSDTIRISFLKGNKREYGSIYVHNEGKNIVKLFRFYNKDEFYEGVSESINGIVPSDV